MDNNSGVVKSYLIKHCNLVRTLKHMFVFQVKFECKSPIGTRAQLRLEEKFWNHVGPGDDIPGYGGV